MTVLQMQCLLRYLGYDTGGVDGIEGGKTKAALAQFRADYGTGPEGLVGAVAGQRLKKDFWEGMRYFTREEMRCPCGECGGFPSEPSEKLMRIAESVRSSLGTVMDVSSGVRCTAHNRAVGGAANSRHLSGRAMDVRARGRTTSQLLSILRAQPGVAYSYAIDDSYVHFDVL